MLYISCLWVRLMKHTRPIFKHHVKSTLFTIRCKKWEGFFFWKLYSTFQSDTRHKYKNTKLLVAKSSKWRNFKQLVTKLCNVPSLTITQYCISGIVVLITVDLHHLQTTLLVLMYHKICIILKMLKLFPKYYENFP